MLKKLLLALLLAFALATGIFAGLGQGNQSVINVTPAGACQITDPQCPG